MKKTILGSLVGALIIFIWQFLSFALINFHKPAQNYTDKQDAILSFLNSQQLPEGGYIMPSLPGNATMDDHEKLMKESEGKPWVSVQYHQSLETNMVMNMVRGFLVNFVILLLFCWLVRRLADISFGTILASALVVGFIVFLNAHYTSFIWYEHFDIWAHLGDAIISWGLVGLWLGWLMGTERRNVERRPVRQSAEVV